MIYKNFTCGALLLCLLSLSAIAQPYPDAITPKPEALAAPVRHFPAPVSFTATAAERYGPLAAGWAIGFAGFRSGNHACYLEDQKFGNPNFGHGGTAGGTLHPTREYFTRSAPAVIGTVITSELLRHFGKARAAGRLVDYSSGLLAGIGMPQFGNCS